LNLLSHKFLDRTDFGHEQIGFMQPPKHGIVPLPRVET
jgi:hypothetical protein